MMSFLKGLICEVAEQSVTLEVQGIGFTCQVSHPAQFKLNKIEQIYTYVHWNQEQGPSLYGFSDPLERTAFLLIISCSGIGPKLALALLRQLTPGAFFSAIMLSDSKALSSVSGVGTKKAEALILNLKDKVNKMNQDGSLGNLKAHAGHIHDVAQALGSLEYSRSEIAAVLDQLPQQIAIETASFQDLMRKALSLASKQRTTLQN